MPDLLDREARTALRAGGDERLARVELRRQIGRLEAQLASLFADAFPRIEIDAGVAAVSSEPRALGLGELEAIRDSLADMISEPRARMRLRISRADIGEPGCGHWHSRPRLGPLGMLMGWWRVKVSSGCPLAGRLAAVEQRQAQS